MPSTLYTKASSLKRSGDISGAVAIYRQILIQQPQDTFAKYNLAASLGDLGFFAESSTLIQQVINSNFKHVEEPLLVYARAQVGLHQFAEAKSAYEKVLALNPNNLIYHREYAQLIWVNKGDWQLALAKLQHAISLSTQPTELMILCSELAGQMGQTQQQYHLINDCYQRAQSDERVAFHLSKACLAHAKFNDAEQLAAPLAKKYSQDLNCNLHWINCLLSQGDASRALTVLTELENLYPNNQHVIALTATCWRLLQDSRYDVLYNYDDFVKQYPLGVPNGWSRLSDYLDDLESELDESHRAVEHPFFLSVRHGSQLPSITSSTKPAMKAFATAVQQPMERYIQELGVGKDRLRARNSGKVRLFSSWSVKLFANGFHVNHVHQEGWLSSACHLRLAKTNSEKQGWLKLGEPGCMCEPKLPADKYIQPKRGHIVIFPSYVWHGTVQFTDKTDRLTIASDFLPS